MSNLMQAPVIGTSGDDVLRGRTIDELFSAGGGQDRIYAAGGNDVAYGGSGGDFIYGEVGNDTLFGGGGSRLPASTASTSLRTTPARSPLMVRRQGIETASAGTRLSTAKSRLSRFCGTMPALPEAGEISLVAFPAVILRSRLANRSASSLSATELRSTICPSSRAGATPSSISPVIRRH